MPRVIVVTGTDTGVGKTFVTAALVRVLVARGLGVIAVKPIETGCEVEPSEHEDGVALARATGQLAPGRALITMRAPVTPALAAEREGRRIDLDVIGATTRAFGSDADVLLVEGAGGLLSPLTWRRDIVHLARLLVDDPGELRWIVVAQDKLGTLHVTRATLHVLSDRGVVPAALVVSEPAEPDASTGSNVDALVRTMPPGMVIPVVALPRSSEAEAEAALAGVVDIVTRA